MKQKLWKRLAIFTLIAAAIAFCKCRKVKEDDWA